MTENGKNGQKNDCRVYEKKYKLRSRLVNFGQGQGFLFLILQEL